MSADKFFEQCQAALAAGLTFERATLELRTAYSDLQGDRAFALDEQGIDPYPHLADPAEDAQVCGSEGTVGPRQPDRSSGQAGPLAYHDLAELASVVLEAHVGDRHRESFDEVKLAEGVLALVADREALLAERDAAIHGRDLARLDTQREAECVGELAGRVAVVEAALRKVEALADYRGEPMSPPGRIFRILEVARAVLAAGEAE